MFKKLSKESDIVSLKCANKNGEKSDLSRSEYLLLKNVIGSLNVKRWNALRTAFCCKTNENFVTKLLDIAQDYFNREKITEETSINEIHFLKSNNKRTNSVQGQKINNSSQDQNTEETQYFDKGKPICKDLIAKNKNVVIDNRDFVDDNNGKNNQSICDNKTTNCKNSVTEDIPKIANLDVNKTSDSDKKKPLLENNKEHTFKSDDIILELDTKYNVVDENRTSDYLSSDLDVSQVKICQYCSASHTHKECPIYYPHYKIEDCISFTYWVENHKETFENIKNTKPENPTETNSELLDEKKKYSYSAMSLPETLYFADTNTIHGLGVFAKNDIKPFSQFGPLVGKMVKEVDIPEDFGMKDLWEITYDGGNIYLNTECIIVSNWLKYIRPAPKIDAKNLIVVSKDKKLYFVTATYIRSGEELLYWQDSPFSTNKKKMEKNTCGGCNMVFTHPHYYRIHCSVFHDLRYSLTIRKYHCKVCGAAILGKENIMKHAAELHNGQGAYQCQFCKKFFLRLNYLEMHRTYGCSANPHRSRPLCDFCGRKFCQPQKLKVHIQRMHSDFSEVLKEFQCKSCLKLLGSRAALQRHSKEVHNKQIEDACSCAKCGKRFQNKSNLKIHMLTHSGIKPFRCSTDHCNAAFTTKQCLQFHYKKVHNCTEQNMPKIERSVDYTFQAYSGFLDDEEKEKDQVEKNVSKETPASCDEASERTDDDDSIESQDIDIPGNLPFLSVVADEQNSPPPSSDSPTNSYNMSPNTNIRVLSKGSKKWIADNPSHSEYLDLYVTEKMNKNKLTDIPLQETELHNRNKHIGVSDFNRQDASNASLLVEAALDSVCSEPNIDIDVGTPQSCSDSLVNNLYSLTQRETLPDVSYTDTSQIQDSCNDESRDVNLISPLVNNNISVSAELNNDIQHNHMRMDYSNFHHDFGAPNSPEIPRSNFVRHYVNVISSHNTDYDEKNVTPVPSPPRYDFGHAGNTDQLSSDDSNEMAAQNLSLHNYSKTEIYKSSYKTNSQNYISKFENNDGPQNQMYELNQDDLKSSKSKNIEISEVQPRLKYFNPLPNNIRTNFEIDLDLRLKSYNIDNDNRKQKNVTYDNEDIDFKPKGCDLTDLENRNKLCENVDSDLRIDRNIEPLILNSSELQGLDMSARNFHNYPNINRYHLYPDVDRVDLRFNYSPPAPAYTHSDILRVVSLDLTSPGRHSVDLSLRSHSLHQITNTRLLAEHGLQTNTHRLLDQSRLSSDLNSTRHITTDSRLISDSSRILPERTTNRILTANINKLASSNLPSPEQNKLITDNSRAIADSTHLHEHGRLMAEGTILTPTIPSGPISPVQGFNVYSVNQNPFHPTSITPRQHVSSPTPYHHYPSYY